VFDLKAGRILAHDVRDAFEQAEADEARQTVAAASSSTLLRKAAAELK
jgi:hypothetical protein